MTIIPRGRALGVTMNLPERDKWSIKKNELEARLAMMYGGRVAEQIIFGADNVTTGASNDIQQATNMARSMVTIYGMLDKLGRVRYKGSDNGGYIGMSAQDGDYSEETRREIDQEVKRITDNAEMRALKVLTDNIHHLHHVAEALLEYESLSGNDVQKIIAGEEVRVTASDSDKPQSSLPPLV